MAAGDYQAAAIAYSSLALTAPGATARAGAALDGGIAARAASDGALATALLEIADGSAKPGTATAVRASYLLALQLSNSGDAAGAVDVLRPLVEGRVGGHLWPYVLAAFASALDSAGQRTQGAAAWKELLAVHGLPVSLRATAHRGLAANARAARNLKEDIAQLQQVAHLTADPADMAALALAAQQADDWATFKREALAIVRQDPGSSQAVEMLATLNKAHVEVDPGQAALVDYRHGDDAAVEALLVPALQAPGVTRVQRAFYAYYLAAAYEADSKISQAIASYDQAAATGAQSSYVHRAKYWAAELVATTGDLVGASARFAALVEHGPPGEFTQEAAFQAGYLLYRAGQPAAALTLWKTLNAREDARLLYWEGRAEATANEASLATASYHAAVAANPYDFFGIQAAQALGAPAPSVAYQHRNLSRPTDWAAISAWLALKVGSGSMPGPSTAAEDLSAMGLRSQAEQALADASGGAGPWKLLGLLREAVSAGLADAAAQLATQLVTAAGATPATTSPGLLRLEYPIIYVNTLAAVGQTDKIDPLFLAAVIYEESLWNPVAGSSAGALGLMQLIPSTAQDVATRLGLGTMTPDRLLQPAVNIQLGAYYLGEQLSAFGTPSLALAAYNAGPGNAARWKSAWNGSTVADLVEEIDYSETRSYVEQIVSTYALYQLAYATG